MIRWQLDFDRPSMYPAGAGVFFVPKKDLSRLSCINHRELNEMNIIRNELELNTYHLLLKLPNKNEIINLLSSDVPFLYLIYRRIS